MLTDTETNIDVDRFFPYTTLSQSNILREGNVFTGVCLHTGEGMGISGPMGDGVCLGGWICPGGIPTRGGYVQGLWVQPGKV